MNIYKILIKKIFKAEMNVNAKDEKEALKKSIDLVYNCDEETLNSDKVFDSTPIYSYEVDKCIAELESLKNECK